MAHPFILSFVVNLAVTTGAVFCLRKFALKLATTVQDAVKHTHDSLHSHIVDEVDQLAQAVKHSHNSLSDAIGISQAAVAVSLAEHSAAVASLLSDVRGYSKQVIDARGQSLNPVGVERAQCPSCQRICYKFQKRGDGSILRCLDCAARGK